MYDRITHAPVTLMAQANADHYIYVNICPDALTQFGQFEVCSNKVWDMQRAHDLVNHFATAFLLEQLHGDSTAGSVINSEDVDFPGIEIQSK